MPPGVDAGGVFVCVLDLLMLRTAFTTHEEGLVGNRIDYKVVEERSKPNGYWIEEIDELTFFHGHAATIFLRLGGKT